MSQAVYTEVRKMAAAYVRSVNALVAPQESQLHNLYRVAAVNAYRMLIFGEHCSITQAVACWQRAITDEAGN